MAMPIPNLNLTGGSATSGAKGQFDGSVTINNASNTPLYVLAGVGGLLGLAVLKMLGRK